MKKKIISTVLAATMTFGVGHSVFATPLTDDQKQQMEHNQDKYADIINKGTFIPLEKKGDKNDQIIAYARHLNGKTLLVVANKNVNRNESCSINVPTIKPNQELKNLLPTYGTQSSLQIKDGKLAVDLGPARIHVFEIDTPNIENYAKEIYKQNL